jgi:hypothetical protein
LPDPEAFPELLGLLPVVEEEDDVEEAGDEEVWEAGAWAGVLAGAGDTLGELLLLGWEPVLRSWGELSPVAPAVVESANLQEAAVELLRLVTVVLLLRTGETAPGDGTP